LVGRESKDLKPMLFVLLIHRLQAWVLGGRFRGYICADQWMQLGIWMWMCFRCDNHDRNRHDSGMVRSCVHAGE
jgi:hypothetical protein